MPYIHSFRVLAESYNCLSTYPFDTEEEAIQMLRRLHSEGLDAHFHLVMCNTDPQRADWEYRYFDIVQLENQVGIVLCEEDEEPEFHGLRPNVDEALDYIDNYWYETLK